MRNAITYKTFHSSSANKAVHSNVGLVLAIDVIKKILQAIMLMTVKYLINLSAVPSLHSSTLRPDFKILCNISIFHLKQYQLTFSTASSKVLTGKKHPL